jgi:IclR family transcriptional regulator, pca regulon regulatory protein
MPRGRAARRVRAAEAASAPITDPNYMQSLARGLDVIRAFEHARPSLSITEAARLSNISRAAARRCLHTLAVLGYVSGKDGVYQLTPRVLTLGYAYLSGMPVARIAQPVLERLSERLNESCSMAVLDGSEIVYVARAAIRRIMSVGLAVGSRLPAYCTSMGRVLLAFAPEAEQAAYLERAELVRQTPHTIVERSLLRRELQRIRTQGYAIVDQELELGLRAIAVPVRLPDGSAGAAINLGAQAARIDAAAMVKSYLPHLLAAADDIALTMRR